MHIIYLHHIAIEGFEAKSHKELLEKFQIFIEDLHLHNVEVFHTDITFAEGMWYGTMLYAEQSGEDTDEREELEEDAGEEKHRHNIHGTTMVNKPN